MVEGADDSKAHGIHAKCTAKAVTRVSVTPPADSKARNAEAHCEQAGAGTRAQRTLRSRVQIQEQIVGVTRKHQSACRRIHPCAQNGR